MSTDKQLGSFEYNRLLKNGLRLGDQITVHNFQMSKKTIRLNRVRYEFHSLSKPLTEAHPYPLSGLKNQSFSVYFGLSKNPRRPACDEDRRFYFKSLNHFPVVHNGNLSFEGYLERGDEVEIGFNRLSLKPTVYDEFEGSKLWPKQVQHVLDNHYLYERHIPLYLSGETGVGKTYLAKHIHSVGGDIGPFVHLNLASLAPNLIESELFGHVKGAFTGANMHKVGAFMQANHGTLFLDEIDSISKDVQVKLLLFLDDRSFRPVGAERTCSSKAKLIFASGQALSKLVSEGKFRRDLYYRICSGLEIEIPSLREDRERIFQLCKNFCFQHCLSIDPQLLDYYRNLDWPGNIRQLIAHLNKKRWSTKGKRLCFSKIDYELEGEFKLFKKILEEDRFVCLKNFKESYIQLVYKNFNNSIDVSSRVLKVSPNTVRRAVSPR